MWISIFKIRIMSLPSQRGTVELHMTFPSCIMQVMDSDPWVLTKPSSQWKETELPRRNLSPKRLPFMGIPGSWHSFWPKANEKHNCKTLNYLHEKTFRILGWKRF